MQDTALENSVLEEILEGLRGPEKYVSSKYFYDANGAVLFDEITKLDEYYLTRTEYAIFERYLADMVKKVEPYTCLIEYGSGSGTKTRWLLENLSGLTRYIPIDISADQLESSARRLSERYPHIDIDPLNADFTRDLSIHLSDLSTDRTCVFFPGSTIGNFEYPDATELLRRIARIAGKGGALLIGVDLAKDKSIVEPAYNDHLGLTERFNKNILIHVNALTGSDFDVDKFEHQALYNEEQDRVEMYLVSTQVQTVRVEGMAITIEKNERIRTEYSYKYPLESFRKMSEEAGFDIDHIWIDDDNLFSVQFLRVR